jgi:hypothetical protein
VLWRELVVNEELLKEARGELSAARRGRHRQRRARLCEVASGRRAEASLLAVHHLQCDSPRSDDRRSRRQTGEWLTTLAAVIACSIALVVLSSANLTRLVLRPLGR